MSLFRRKVRLASGVALAALVGAVSVTAAPAQARTAPDPSTETQQLVPQHPGPPGAVTARHPLLLKVLGHDKQGRPLVAAGAPGGYTAAQLRAAAGLQGTGEGQTVAVVDAFDDPYATQDLNTYSTQMGLPGVCNTHQKKNCFHFTQLHPDGIGGFDPGWGLETSLDIEMIHALAPQASITLVEAVDNTTEAMFRAIDYAASLHPAAISNSWGLGNNGEFTDEASFDQHCQLTDSVCVFSTGDSGNPGTYPAWNPHVLAIGGTTLSLNRTGAVLDETAWSRRCNPDFPDICGSSAGGGGVSQFEPRPAYQDRVNLNPGRGIPDVSFDADPNSGVAVYFTGADGWLTVGGTSVGAPAWAGILAAADQLRAAAGKPALTAAGDQVQNAIYQLATGLADITTGSNGNCGAVCTAGPGYDFVTGLGSPRAGIDTALAAAP